MNIFEIATKNKFRFPYRGMITVEDLWDLNLNQLDGIYKTLNKEVKQNNEESLLSVKDAADVELQAKIDIVKHIFTAKQQEITNRTIAAENAEKKRRILDIIAQKQEASLQNKSEEELLKMLDEIDS